MPSGNPNMGSNTVHSTSAPSSGMAASPSGQNNPEGHNQVSSPSGLGNNASPNNNVGNRNAGGAVGSQGPSSKGSFAQADLGGVKNQSRIAEGKDDSRIMPAATAPSPGMMRAIAEMQANERKIADEQLKSFSDTAAKARRGLVLNPAFDMSQPDSVRNKSFLAQSRPIAQDIAAAARRGLKPAHGPIQTAMDAFKQSQTGESGTPSSIHHALQTTDMQTEATTSTSSTPGSIHHARPVIATNNVTDVSKQAFPKPVAPPASLFIEVGPITKSNPLFRHQPSPPLTDPEYVTEPAPLSPTEYNPSQTEMDTRPFTPEQETASVGILQQAKHAAQTMQGIHERALRMATHERNADSQFHIQARFRAYLRPPSSEPSSPYEGPSSASNPDIRKFYSI